LTQFETPEAVSPQPEIPPPNALGLRSIMFAVDDIDGVVDRLRAHGAELVGGLDQDEDRYRLCSVRGPDGMIIALAQQLA
jgi:catechol 2,3-dioxygenase-like lactoylglutathione lyase family enzyme